MNCSNCDHNRVLVRNARTKLIVPGLLVLVLVLVYGARILFAGPSASDLRDKALNGASVQDQREAARMLADMGVDGLQDLREVARQSDNEEVVAVCLIGLSRQLDDECMDLFLSKLDDSDLSVRVAASKACTKILGRNHHFPVEGRLEDRQQIKEQMAKDWESYNGSELYEFNKNRFKEKSN